MINVVLDTNVLVGALFNKNGVHADLLRLLIGNPDAFGIIVSSQILDEYRDVLSREFIAIRGMAKDARDLLELINEASLEVIPKFVPALVYPDVADKPFLEAAVYVDGILITNNLRDFPFLGVRILRAGEFLKLMDSSVKG